MGRASRNFATFNKTVDDGWLAILTKNEQAVLSVYRRYVDPDGESYPGSDLIIKAIRHQDQSHLSRIRKKLVEYGLMEIIDAGGGRGKSVRVKLLYPKAPPAQKKREAKPCQNGDENLAKTLPNKTVNLAKSEAKPCQIDHLHNKEEQLINSSSSNRTAAAEIFDALTAAEIGEPTRRELAGIPGITADIISRINRSTRERGKGTGAVVENIRAASEAAKAKKTSETPEQRRARAAEENRLAREKRNA